MCPIKSALCNTSTHWAHRTQRENTYPQMYFSGARMWTFFFGHIRHVIAQWTMAVSSVSRFSSLLETPKPVESSSGRHQQWKTASFKARSPKCTLHFSISFWVWKSYEFFSFHLMFLSFEFYLNQAWASLDFYLIIYSPELTVRLKPDQDSDIVKALSSFWFMGNEFALCSQSIMFSKRNCISY